MKVELNEAGLLFTIMLGLPCLTIALALFAETIFAAKILFILSLVAMFIFVVRRIQRVKPQEDLDV
jgi:membrane protein implicated in regulation of membrane protease activity